jgi:hypothetical protein
MRNKVEIRAFAVEQVVKMKFVDECDAAKVVEEAKVLESYIVGGAEIPEYANDTSEMVKMFESYKDSLIKLYEERNPPMLYHDIMGCDLKPNEA